jgi:predicted DsbA family dithiol-disulfide isomerase
MEETGLGVTILYRAFELDPNVPTDGPPLVEYLERKFGDRSRVQASHARLTSAGAELGIDFRWSLMRRANTFDAHRLLVWALRTEGPAAQGRLKHGLLRAYFEEGRHVADPEVLADVAAEVGFADQSHMTRAIGRARRAPPGRLRRTMRTPPSSSP